MTNNKILVLGGTGAMGVPLVQMLAQDNNVYVTTRRNLPSEHNVTYIQGNAKNLVFLRDVLSLHHWNAVVDFMMWGREFDHVVPLFLNATKQYVFISSARVYSQTDEHITEETPRLLDVSDDEEYLKTNEYALAKAREEDILRNSGKNNFTIIRPSITYNNYRLQLGVFEKEAWLYRALKGRSIVFSKDIADKLTTMTWGDDVASCISSVVGNERALGQTFHATCSQSLSWLDVLDIYCRVLEEHLGHRPRVVMTEKSTKFRFPASKYQIIYCRYFNRTFDNSKIGQFADVKKFVRAEKGLAKCLKDFLANPQFKSIDWSMEAINDKAAGERASLSEMPSFGAKLSYICYRYNLTLVLSLLMKLKTFLIK